MLTSQDSGNSYSGSFPVERDLEQLSSQPVQETAEARRKGEGASRCAREAGDLSGGGCGQREGWGYGGQRCVGGWDEGYQQPLVGRPSGGGPWGLMGVHYLAVRAGGLSQGFSPQCSYRWVP